MEGARVISERGVAGRPVGLRAGDATARKITAEWRRLTGGGRGRDGERRTLLACSGGADSSALVLALAARVRGASGVFVVAHVLHDLRPAAEARTDLEAARGLAGRLGLPFAQGEVRAREAGGNLEGAARRLRYGALARLAAEHGCPFVATAHHADDQLETVLMALLRGAGARGLAGIAESRGLVRGVRLIRPMLGATRAEARRLCVDAGHAWQEDASNADESRLRGALRARVLPVLRGLRPAGARRASASARLLRGAAELVAREGDAINLAGPAPRWSREALRVQAEVVVGEALRLAARSLCGAQGRDRLGTKQIMPAVRAIRSGATDPKVFTWSGLRLTVTANEVHMEVTG